MRVFSHSQIESEKRYQDPIMEKGNSNQYLSEMGQQLNLIGSKTNIQEEVPAVEKHLVRDEAGKIIKRSIIGQSEFMQQMIQQKYPKKLEQQVTSTSSSKVRSSLLYGGLL